MLFSELNLSVLAVNGGQGMQTGRSSFEFCDPMEPVQLRTAPFPATNGSSPHHGLPSEQGRGAVPGPSPFQPDTGMCFYYDECKPLFLRSIHIKKNSFSQ